LLEQRIGICYGGGRAEGVFYTKDKEQSKFAHLYPIARN